MRATKRNWKAIEHTAIVLRDKRLGVSCSVVLLCVTAPDGEPLYHRFDNQTLGPWTIASIADTIDEVDAAWEGDRYKVDVLQHDLVEPICPLSL